MTTDDTEAMAREILKGMERVPQDVWLLPERWACTDTVGSNPPTFAGSAEAAAHFARCSPTNLRSILEDYIRVKGENRAWVDAFNNFDGPTESWNAALEEAAKVAVGHDDGTSGGSLRYNLACQRIAAAIRSLKR